MQVKLDVRKKRGTFNLTIVDHLYVNHLFVMVLLPFFEFVFLPVLLCFLYPHSMWVLWFFALVVSFVRCTETNVTALEKRMLEPCHKVHQNRNPIKTMRFVYSCSKQMHELSGEQHFRLLQF